MTTQAANLALASTRGSGPADPLHIRAVRTLLYALGLSLYLLPLATPAGVGTAVGAAIAGMWAAGRAHRRALRLPVVALGAPLAVLLSLVGGELLVDWEAFSTLLGARPALFAAEVLSLGLAGFFTGFLLRFLSLSARALSLLEVLFVAGSVVALLSDHRNRMLNRPRFFSDWAWSQGLNPATILMALGVAATIAGSLLLLRRQPLLKLVTTLLLMVLLAVSFSLLWDRRVAGQSPRDALGLSGKGAQRDGTGGTGQSDNPFKDSYSSDNEPTPVAVAILRDDLQSRSPILYFRQNVLSSYNGHHLVADASGRHDRDVITQFPREGSISAATPQSADNHIEQPTTMYLLVDHPQPLGLTHSQRVTLAKNPNPQQFVAAYDVESLVLAVDPERLLGRRSVPASWDAATRRHYTAVPEDPRYRALADIIVRDVDPRFAGDDLARSFAIKRYLEREGFYTMRSTHASSADPTASFLFGSLRGYCVHFAHAAAYLLRSAGIAARVALGYAVQINKRDGGSSILIMSDRAHAWPEIHLDGIGWVTFDIYPERTDMPAPTPVDYDLEQLLGELARNDETAGLSPDGRALVIPWGLVLGSLGLLAAALLALAYLIKAYRRLAPTLRRGGAAYPRVAYVAILDLLADLGGGRRRGETRERHARRLSALAPHMEELTSTHLASSLGGREVDAARFAALVAAVRDDVRQRVPRHRRLLAHLHPFGWLRTR